VVAASDLEVEKGGEREAEIGDAVGEEEGGRKKRKAAGEEEEGVEAEAGVPKEKEIKVSSFGAWC